MSNIKLDNFSMQTRGDIPAIGDKAPNFVLTQHDMMPVGLEDFKDNYTLLNIFPSIDTETCFASVKHFYQWVLNNEYNEIKIACVSMDLPYALDRVRREYGFTNLTFLSDFRDHMFGCNYGVLVDSGPLAGLLARAIILIDQQQVVRYVELVEDISKPCNYNNAQQAISQLIDNKK